jgi:hypothetical protein
MRREAHAKREITRTQAQQRAAARARAVLALIAVLEPRPRGCGDGGAFPVFPPSLDDGAAPPLSGSPASPGPGDVICALSALSISAPTDESATPSWSRTDAAGVLFSSGHADPT